MKTPFSFDDDERLRALARSGLSLREIAYGMERSKSSIRTRAINLNVAIAREQEFIRLILLPTK